MCNLDVEDVAIADLDIYPRDDRISLQELYGSYEELVRAGWKKEIICYQTPEIPIYGYSSPKIDYKPQESLYIIGGIHGEEPAGPCAFAREIETIIKLSNKIPIVFIGVANPDGYRRGSRYPNAWRDSQIGLSVGDSAHLLPKDNSNEPRESHPSSTTAYELTGWLLKKSEDEGYVPLMVMDHHEDEEELGEKEKLRDTGLLYSYAYGDPKELNLLSPMIAKSLEKSGFSMRNKGGLKTRFDEEITPDGLVYNSQDSSVDNLLASEVYIIDGKRRQKTAARVVFVIETTLYPDNSVPLERRVNAHRRIIRLYGDLLEKLGY